MIADLRDFIRLVATFAAFLAASMAVGILTREVALWLILEVGW